MKPDRLTDVLSTTAKFTLFNVLGGELAPKNICLTFARRCSFARIEDVTRILGEAPIHELTLLAGWSRAGLCYYWLEQEDADECE